MPVSDQEFARIRNKVLQLEEGGIGGGGISSVNLYVSGNNGTYNLLTGDSFYISGNAGITFDSNNDPNIIYISSSAKGISEIPLAAQTYTNISTIYTVAGGASMNAGDFNAGSQKYFKASGYADGSSKLEIVLYNLTDNVAVKIIGITSSVATSSISSQITLTGDKFYEARIKRVDGTISDNVYLLNASIRIV